MFPEMQNPIKLPEGKIKNIFLDYYTADQPASNEF